MSTTSPNMSLPISTIGVDTGLTWEQNLNHALAILDAHTHNSGDGIQITPSGLNLNSNVPFQGNAATALGAAYFTPLVSILPTSDHSVLYADAAGDLYYNDGGGTQIQITASGALNVISSGIQSGTATASFSGGVLVVLSNTLTPASIKAGSYLMGQTGVSGSNYLTLTPPSSLSGSSYGLTFPSLPGSTMFMTLDHSGNMGTASGIPAAQIASNPSFTGNLSTTGTLSCNTSLTVTGATATISLSNPAGNRALLSGFAELQLYGPTYPALTPSTANSATCLGVINTQTGNFGTIITGPTNSASALRIIRGTLGITIDNSGAVTGVVGLGEGYTVASTGFTGFGSIVVTYSTAFLTGSTPSLVFSNSGTALSAAIIYEFNLASTRFSTATTSVTFVFGISSGTAATLNIDFTVIGQTEA